MSQHPFVISSGLEVALPHSANNDYPEAVTNGWHGQPKEDYDDVWKETHEPQKRRSQPQNSHRTKIFPIVSLGVIGILIIAVAVLGGVLGSKVHKLSEDRQRYQALATSACGNVNSSAILVTSQAGTTLTNDVLMGRDDCPAVDRTNFTISTYTFLRSCGIDYYDATPDLSQLITASMEDCMTYCVQFNKMVQGNLGESCMAVVYEANITAAIGRTTGNCFLKRNRTQKPISAKLLQAAYVIDTGAAS